MTKPTTATLGIFLISILAGCDLIDKPPNGVGNSNHPKEKPVTPELVRSLKAPPGFRIQLFAKELGESRMIAVNTDGTVYVTLRKEGQVLALADRNNDGIAEERRPIARNIPDVHGIAIHNNTMYLASPQNVWQATIQPDATISTPKLIIDNLPEGGRHRNRTLAIGPDGMLYITVGSFSNAEIDDNPEHATILIANPDGTNRRIFAKGLRNTIGFGWHPKTGEMWGMDHGSDWRGDDVPLEELNQLVEGKDYGWPFVYNNRVPDFITEGWPPGYSEAGSETGGISREDAIKAYSEKTEPMTLGYTAHSSPIQMAFYTGKQFPAEFQNDAFIAFRGSWNREKPAGFKIARIKFDKTTNQPTAFEDFVTGWLTDNGQSHFGRIAGVAVATDGALLVCDDVNGAMYRISYQANTGVSQDR